ncbi:unnamed protein product [Vitrella brassicaformis CCMP3155]|uniref:FAD-binding domain-containing protein n=2 Tax=Vitrella brassicaformis TaxID=1169539 RepID=A0A0G4EED0_VITBC|nr:unnamed protein product [Vitrella brassicaformis CCMP3155]|mmetsp:Transcript_38338/g.109547  ORF Transcript_38338/g.109547 Transcript_38338/m.109547 type:complete len:575 (+) Transcript_38338:118-1842(+)|eukprot:CEL93712.1 unnamed protein product [Vitrella brassicaformis CCMP3155]
MLTHSQAARMTKGTSFFVYLHVSASAMVWLLLAAAAASPLREPVLIVGGGPAGLSTAILLAKRGYSDITVVEKSPWREYFAASDPSSHTVSLTERGQLVLRTLDWDLAEAVRAHSLINAMSNVTHVGADGLCEQIAEKAAMVDSVALLSSGKLEKRHRGSSSSKELPKEAWQIPRHTLVRLLSRHLMRSYPGQVRLLTGREVVDVVPGTASEPHVGVLMRQRRGRSVYRESTCKAHLVIGADGRKSQVSQVLAKLNPERFSKIRPTLARPAGRNPSEDTPVCKTISLPAELDLQTAAGPQRLAADTFATLQSPEERVHAVIYAAPRAGARHRSAVIVAPAEHRLMEERDPRRVADALADAFPQLRGVVWSAREVVRYARRRAVDVDGCHYMSHCWCSWRGKESGDSRGYVAILGEATRGLHYLSTHGLDAALEDVLYLDAVLQASNHSLSRALPAFSKARVRQMRALTSLAAMHPHLPFPLGPTQPSLVSAVDFAVRWHLSRWMPFSSLIHPPVPCLLARADLTYEQVWRRACRTSGLLGFAAWMAEFSLAVGVLWLATGGVPAVEVEWTGERG